MAEEEKEKKVVSLFEVFFDKETMPAPDYLDLVARSGDWQMVFQGLEKNLIAHVLITVKENPAKFTPDFQVERFLHFIGLNEYQKQMQIHMPIFARDPSEHDVFTALFADWFYELQQKVLPDLLKIQKQMIQ